jgi:hypothetical protein
MKRRFVTDAIAEAIGIKSDSAESVFVERQLLSLRAKLYEPKRGPYQARVLMPVNNEDDPGAKTIAYQIMDGVGVAKLISDYAKDFPRVDVFIREEYAPIKGIGASFGISVDEMRSAAFAKRPLSTMKRTPRARRWIRSSSASRCSATRRTGSSACSRCRTSRPRRSRRARRPARPGATAPAVGAGNKTPDEILADLNRAISTVRTLTQDNEYIDTILIPIAQHNVIKTKARTTTSDTTILKFFLENNSDIPGLQVIAVPRIAGKGAGATDRLMGYRRDPDVIELPEPLPFTMSPPQMEGRELVTYCESKMAAPINRLPLACIYLDGI